MVAMNEGAKLMRLWAGVSLREGCHASNVIVVSLMTELKKRLQ